MQLGSISRKGSTQARTRGTRKTVRQGNEGKLSDSGTRKAVRKTVKGGTRKTVKRGRKENCKTGVEIEITMTQE